MSHNLKRLWAAFKGAYPSPLLAKHDVTITTLNKFEQLRYPDAELAKGSIVQFARARAALSPSQGGWPSQPPAYSLVLPDVDSLVQSVFDAAARNPGFYFNNLQEPARGILFLSNAHFTAPAA